MIRLASVLVALAVPCAMAIGACGSDDGGASSNTGASTGSPSSSSGTGASSSSSGAGATSSSSSGEGGSAGEPSAGGGGGSSGCPSTHTCAEAAPANWTGPVVLALGDDQPACIGSYPNNAGALFGDLDPGVASCACTCGAATGIQCNDGADICYTSNLNCNIIACLTPADTLLPGICEDIPSTTSTKVQVTAHAPTNAGSCASQTNHTLPEPTWGVQAKACGGAVTIPDVCEQNEVCTPVAVAPFDKLCIERTGDVTCPNQFYSEKHLVFESLTDTRACSACSCGAASSTCGGKVDLTYPSGSNECAFLVSSVNAGSCGNLDAMVDSAIYAPAPQGTCAPSASTLSGDVTPNAPVTFCCHP